MKSRIKPMTPGIPPAARVRAYLAAVAIGAGLCGVAWRAWALQVEDGDRYRAIAARQHALTVEIPAPRGDIIDVHGRPLAVSADADSIWAHPRDIRDVTDTAEKLAALLGGNPAALEAKLGGDRRFVWLARHVTPELARKMREAHLPGIEVGREPRRWYPERTIGGPVIGRSDIDGRGVDGIELAMNAQLIGQRGEGVALRDVRGKRMFADGLERPQPGATVQLSLDSSIQAIAEAAIAESVRANHARSGVVVVVEVATGRVVAMASSPSYDPNGPGASGAQAGGAASPPGEPGAPRAETARNRAVTDAYEAGSVMKTFSVAAALDDGTVTADTEFDLNHGQLSIGGSRPIRDVDGDPYLTVAGIIKRSSNVGAAKIALRFGAAKLYTALRRFGFGARTGIELPGEQAGMLREPARWRDRDLASISYGYGLSVTPLQIAAAVAAFGNGGLYHAPRIVERVIDGDGTLLYQAEAAERRVVSERTAATMLAMLASTFEGGKQSGTAATIVVPGFRCAGKTGTANKYDPSIRGYAEDRYLSSFAGLAPLDHPRLAIVAMVDEPSDGDHFGAKVAGPVFARVASEALRYLGVPGGPAVCARPAAPVPGQAASSAPAGAAAPAGAVATCLPAPPAPRPGAGGGARPGAPASATAPPPGAPGAAASFHIRIDAGGAAARVPGPGASPLAAPGSFAGPPRAPGPLETWLGPSLGAWLDRSSPGAPLGAGSTEAPAVIPDLRGMGMAHAIAVARRAHLAVAISGTGRVVEQRPAPGASQAAPQIWLRLSDGSVAAVATGSAAPSR